MKYSFVCLRLLAGILISTRSSPAATVLADDFSTSSLNSLSPAAPTASSAAYHLLSSKSWSPAPAMTANDLKFGIGTTTSGHIEVQALFTTKPVALTNTGDYLELTVTFTNTTGLFAQAGHVGFGLFNSGGIAPIAGGMNGTATTNPPTLFPGGAQGWRGYVARVAYSGGSHNIATRPAQSSTLGNNQDLVTEGSNSQSYTGAVSLASAASTFMQAAAQLTESLRITLSAANTFQIESKLYLGGDTNGTLLLNQSATASGVNFLTNSFDALAIGWRATANTTATLMDIKSITVNTSVSIGGGGGPGNSVAAMFFQQQPTDATAGSTISPAVMVVATNSTGAPVTNTSITLSLMSGSGPLIGTLSQLTDANGISTFNNLYFTSAGSKQLRATSGVITANSAGFSITTAPAAALVFAAPPVDVLTNSPMTPAPTVQVRDIYGNNVSTNGISVTMSLSGGTGNLTGTTSANTDAGGLATFSDLRFSATGAKQIAASASPLTGITSSSFNVTNLPTFVPAFPGAEGAGAGASGGRGGDVYYVTTLANSGAGSLRDGISGAPAGGRSILFKVSGNILLTSTLTINKPNLTIAGQTAPGDGICLQNYAFNIDASNVILRHVRTRLGTNALQEADAMWINGGTNIIVDHVSASWSVDETLSTSRSVANLTVQNCFISESLKNSIHVKGEHGYGGIISSANNVTYSYHHNLYAHHASRNPRVGSDSQAGTLRLDFRNNAIYDWGFYAGYSGDTNENVEINYVGNYLVAGPITTQTKAFVGGAATTKIYQSGNYIDNDKDLLLDGVNTGWSMFGGAMTQMASPFAVPTMPTDTAPVALQRVIAQSGAMPWRRDALDRRIAASFRQHIGTTIDFVAGNPFAGDYITNNINGTNFIGVNPWPTLVATTAPTDTDSDGMPDWWEVALALNPNLASDRNLTNALTGYTRLEDYLNWLADAHALCPRNGQVDVSLRSATGGATNLAYTVAHGTNGSVTLLGDGYTARFTSAANYNGVANFTFIATDPAAATAFGPVNYALLITTTNANNPPVLAVITNRTVIAGATVNFTCSVTDTDTPPQTVTFALQNPAAGATLGTNTGTFNWRPTIAQSNTTNTMNAVASDNGAVSLSSTQSFTVTVLKPVSPTLQTIPAGAGQFSFSVNGSNGPDYTIQASTNLVNWTGIFTTNSPALPFTWTDSATGSYSQRFFRVLLGP